MANTVIAIRSSGSAAATPSLGVLANGEIALNFADGIIYYKTLSNTLGSIKTTQPAGLTTEVQFNDAGSFGANSGFTFSKVTGALTVKSISLTTPLAFSSGGTGSTSYTTGALLVAGDTELTSLANTTYTLTGGLAAANTISSLTVDAYGRVTAATGAAIAIDTAQITSGTIADARLASVGTAGTYANASHVPVITTDAKGRVTAVTNTSIAIDTSQVTSGILGIANGGTGATTLAGASIATYTGTETLTNKRIDPRVVSAASASSLTPSIATADIYAYTALAAGLTINAPTGTPVDGDKLMFRLLDNGTARALTWNATYTVMGVTLPTTTTASKTTYVGCIYNANNTRWDVIAVTTQA